MERRFDISINPVPKREDLTKLQSWLNEYNTEDNNMYIGTIRGLHSNAIKGSEGTALCLIAVDKTEDDALKSSSSTITGSVIVADVTKTPMEILEEIKIK